MLLFFVEYDLRRQVCENSESGVYEDTADFGCHHRSSEQQMSEVCCDIKLHNPYLDGKLYTPVYF